MADQTYRTQSLCPICLERIPARHVSEGLDTYLVKTCPDHGEFKTLIWQGPPAITDWRRPKIPVAPPVTYREVDKGCPFDCGLCPAHRQRTCTIVMEVAHGCDLACPICYADSPEPGGPEPSLKTIAAWFDSAREAGGDCNVQISGGEPTIRDDLAEIVAMGRERGFPFLQLNTNGIRLGKDEAYLKSLRQAGLSSLFLQFDGTEDAIYERIRGRRLLADKLRAIEACGRNQLGVVLVATLVPGVNDHNVGDILRLAMEHSPVVRAVHFQPVSLFGRYFVCPKTSERLTLPKLMSLIEEQTEGLFKSEYFRPPGCENAFCSFSANFLINPDGTAQPLGRPYDPQCCPPPERADVGAGRSIAKVARQWAPAGRPAGPALLLPNGNRPAAFFGRVHRAGQGQHPVGLGHGLHGRMEPGSGAQPRLLHPLPGPGRDPGPLLPLQHHQPGRHQTLPPMNRPPRTPLHAWIRAKIGLAQGAELTPAALAAYQLERLNQTLARAREKSPFYARHLVGLPAGPLAGLDDLAAVPFITADDLRHSHLDMLCVSPDEVARVKTMHTSGTTTQPKRVYFSEADLELTTDFFHHGMSTMVDPGQTVLILLPGQTPASVGDLLVQGLARMDVRGVVHGPVRDPAQAVAQAVEVKADCMVGIPVQVLAMAEQPGAGRLRGVIQTILLTTDYVPQSLAARVARAWGCEVFNHYGMTETGLGGGVDCRAHAGLHPREADLYYEVVEPGGSAALPLGEPGEVVFTTLTRQAMPLIRYRTGDWGRLLPGRCPCGGGVRRLEYISGRLANRMDLDGGKWLSLWQLDEALFALPGLLDYRARLTPGKGNSRLELKLRTAAEEPAGLEAKAAQALTGIPCLGPRLADGRVRLGPIEIIGQAWASDGTGKRTFLPAGS